ncbi:nicotinate-nucleotide--dimethylbenzimidazole phosphoribosyltransferase [Xenophilus arseniciresistens]|uniref:Nicotinate-nucleotide--dimethylbenzimidazole phosphoribosyltransferase n=1 Tax=Xenophilus arseniciresistens TaxID=1283306 RepID=A0AAE3SZN2_9BURK|nr:nicotinate-nucleotide--dimethylbenzimidazole phosphoribosyltransferase [Xenophilus arseniciresistens]MDA7417362.1 nicotinate-nucleotide--dimethylbenzimidazole phosphoribosyltransferase [Xenophilus arseniciresistens]
MTLQAADIPPVPSIEDPALRQRLQARLDAKTKPLGALGRLEQLALQIGQVLGTEAPQLHAPQMLVCAADHGLAARGVSAYPADVTWQMVRNFLSGGAAVSVLARQHGLALTVVDCGVLQPTPPQPGLVQRRIAAGTADALQAPAMSAQQCAQAIANGREVVRGLPGNALLLGEMGIGNSSSAALLLARLSGQDIDACTGAGTGLDAQALARKRAVLREVLAVHAQARTPLQALAAFGGFEIATLVGAVLQAAQERRLVVLDGFIASSAVLVAHALAPQVVQRCVAAHQSAEPGHALLLRLLGLQPLLQMDLRLGEGSGAALAWPLLESACRILSDMASFESAGVSGPA